MWEWLKAGAFLLVAIAFLWGITSGSPADGRGDYD